MNAKVGIGVALVLGIFTLQVAHAFTRKLPEIPPPKFTAVEAITAAERCLKEVPNGQDQGWLLVGVDWCQSAEFAKAGSRLSDGTHWVVTEAQSEWSWFLTYVNRQNAQKGVPAIRVLRVLQDGHVSFVAGIRT